MIPILLFAVGMYNPAQWLLFPAMNDVRCISASSDRLYIAVPEGVYILDRSDHRPVRTLTSADDIVGTVQICAFNPVRGDLFVTTGDRLYQYLSLSDQVTPLFPPFKQVLSIGIAPDAAYFDTEQGLFRKERLIDQYEKVENVPGNVTWYGQRDLSKPEDYVFLVPYYLTDNQLNNHRMTLVFRDPRGRHLYVASENYGVTVYSTSLGLPQYQIRMGPTDDEITRITSFDNRLWFSGREWAVSLDPQNNWNYVRTRAGDLPAIGSKLLSADLLDLQRRENINAMLPESLTTWLGTDKALYALGPKGKLTKVLTFNLPVNGLARFGDSLLIGTDAGLYLLRKDSLTELQDPFNRAGFGVYSIAQPLTGSLWLGTIGGLLMMARSDSWEQIIPPGYDLSKPVRGLAAYGNTVFFDNGSGVTAYTLSDTSDTSHTSHVSYSTIDHNSGLPSTDITGLYADDRYLWIASPGLLSRFDYRSEIH